MSRNQSNWASDSSSLDDKEKTSNQKTWIDVHIAKAKLVLEKFKNEQKLLWVLSHKKEDWDIGEAYIADKGSNNRYNLLRGINENKGSFLFSNYLRKVNTDHWFDIVIWSDDNSQTIMSWDWRFYRVLDRKLYENISKSDFEKHSITGYNFAWKSTQQQKFEKILQELQNFLWYDHELDTIEYLWNEKISTEVRKAKMLDEITDSEYDSIFIVGETDSQAIRTEAGTFDVTQYMRKKAINWLIDGSDDPKLVAEHIQDYSHNFSLGKDYTTSIEVLDYDMYLQWEEKVISKNIDFTITSWYELDYEKWNVYSKDSIQWTKESIDDAFKNYRIIQIASLNLPENSIVRFRSVEHIPEQDWVDKETWEVITIPAHQKLDREYFLITGDPKKYEDAKNEVGRNLL